MTDSYITDSLSEITMKLLRKCEAIISGCNTSSQHSCIPHTSRHSIVVIMLVLSEEIQYKASAMLQGLKSTAVVGEIQYQPTNSSWTYPELFSQKNHALV